MLHFFREVLKSATKKIELKCPPPPPPKWDLLIEMRPSPECGPFHQFGAHVEQVCNCGLLWKQWIFGQKNRSWGLWFKLEDIWGFCLMYKNGFVLCRKSHWDRLTNSQTSDWWFETRWEDKECRIWAVVWLWIPPNILANISVKCCICCQTHLIRGMQAKILIYPRETFIERAHFR